MNRKEYNFNTGETQTIELTPAEIAKTIADSTPTAGQIKQAERNQALADLETLDRASIRDIREYIAAKLDAPILLKDRELAAIALREKLKL